MTSHPSPQSPSRSFAPTQGPPSVHEQGATRRVTVLVRADLPAALRAQIAALSPRVRVIGDDDIARGASSLEHVDVVFAQFVDPEFVTRAPRLAWIQTYGAGVEWLLTREVVERETLRITNASGIHAQPIAEHAFGFILTFARNLHLSAERQRSGHWDQTTLREGLHTLAGTTLTVLGLGAIGAGIAKVAKAFDMRVTGVRRSGENVHGVDRVVSLAHLHDVLASADYVVNVLPLTDDTRHVLGAREFAAMRRSAFFVNVGRGGTVDTEALTAALARGELAGAGLDVVEPEPLPPDHALWMLPNVFITPHYSGAHPDYAERVTAIFVDNLARYLAGEPLRNQVDKRAGY